MAQAKRMIFLLTGIMLILALCVTPVSAKTTITLTDNALSEAYPFEQAYWIIFNEGYRDGRLEASTIDSTLPEDSLYLVWDTSVELNDASGSGSCDQYYYDENDGWVYIGSYHRLTDWATEIVASNLDVYDADGNLILEKDLNYFGGSATHALTVEFRPKSTELPSAIKFVPYNYSFESDDLTESFTLTKGRLPSGLTLNNDGIVSGMPTELGVFSFTVTQMSGANTEVEHKCTLTVLWQGGVDVEESNEPGYGFVESATSDGRVHDQFVTSAEELKPQTMHCEAPYTEFYALYLDGRKLIRDVEYYATEGSTRNTLTDKTLADAGSGTHVLTAEFHTKSSGGGLAIKYTTQKYTITGILGKNVNVVVKGVPVVWTDAEPYVNADSRTMVPFRIIADALGLTVDWNSSTREAIFSDGTKTIYFPLDSKTARTGTGGTVTMDTAAVSVNGRSYAPVRYLAEFFGYTVTWDGKTRTVGIEEESQMNPEQSGLWKNLYKGFIESKDFLSNPLYRDAECYLFNLDDDDIPELYVFSNVHASSNYLCTVYQDQLVVHPDGGFGIEYIPRTGRMFSTNMIMGVGSDSVEELRNGEIVTIESGSIDTGDWTGNPESYRWNGNKVSRDEYYQLRKQAFNESKSITLPVSSNRSVEAPKSYSVYGMLLYLAPNDPGLLATPDINS